MTTDVFGAHGGVDRRRATLTEAGALPLAGLEDSRRDVGAFFGRLAAQLAQGHRRYLDVHVDAVEERTRDAAAVTLDQRRRTLTIVTRVAAMTARTGLCCLFAVSLLQP